MLLQVHNRLEDMIMSLQTAQAAAEDHNKQVHDRLLLMTVLVFDFLCIGNWWKDHVGCVSTLGQSTLKGKGSKFPHFPTAVFCMCCGVQDSCVHQCDLSVEFSSHPTCREWASGCVMLSCLPGLSHSRWVDVVDRMEMDGWKLREETGLIQSDWYGADPYYLWNFVRVCLEAMSIFFVRPSVLPVLCEDLTKSYTLRTIFYSRLCAKCFVTF